MPGASQPSAGQHLSAEPAGRSRIFDRPATVQVVPQSDRLCRERIPNVWSRGAWRKDASLLRSSTPTTWSGGIVWPGNILIGLGSRITRLVFDRNRDVHTRDGSPAWTPTDAPFAASVSAYVLPALTTNYRFPVGTGVGGWRLDPRKQLVVLGNAQYAGGSREPPRRARSWADVWLDSSYPDSSGADAWGL